VTVATPVRRRRLGRALALAPVLGYALACALDMHPSLPWDVVINLGPVPHDAALLAPADGRVHLCVLQHGLWRSPWAMWKLERALCAHGYEVLNPGYSSTRGSIADHAARLHDAIEARLAAERREVELLFVGHSMGGLVIEEYLRGASARTPAACVYLAVPHRGAMLCDLRKHSWLFRLLMGDRAALQLSPGDPLHRRPVPMPCPVGTIVGAVGDGLGRNADIDGDDDGTVAACEAHLGGETDSVELPVGHTGMATDGRAIAEVLHFLRHGAFAHP
jgi:pimeloyl-ACP methyl ester carboxylesterase